MSLLHTNRAGRRKLLPGLGSTLACVALLTFGLSTAQSQVSVTTVGGGPRTLCGSWAGFMGGNTWSQAQFNGPVACALDTQSNLWVADFTNADIEEISDAGNTAASATTQFYVQTSVTHKGKVTYTTNFHAFPAVNGIAVDAADSVYILMAQNGTLIKYDQFRNPLSAVLFTNASFVPRASAMCLDGNSNVFLAFTNGMIIRFRLIDGFPPPVYINDLVLGGPLPVDYVVSSFAWQPAGLALLPDGQLAVSDTLNDAIYVVSTN